MIRHDRPSILHRSCNPSLGRSVVPLGLTLGTSTTIAPAKLVTRRFRYVEITASSAIVGGWPHRPAPISHFVTIHRLYGCGLACAASELSAAASCAINAASAAW